MAETPIFGSEAGDYLCHYTTLQAALEHILPETTFRMSPFSEMRDPRESHVWAASAAFYGDVADEEKLFWGFNAALEASKRRFKVMSLTRDEERPPPFEVFGRGFARPRLWEQYGGNHAGACLIFSRSAMEHAMSAALTGHGRTVHREVVYADEPITTHALSFDLNDVAKRGIEPVLAELLNDHTDELFFKKLRDWETEYEYRFVVETQSADAIYIDIGPWLQGLVLGPLVSNSYLPAVRALCDPRSIQVSRLSWMNGRPSALPLPQAPAPAN